EESDGWPPQIPRRFGWHPTGDIFRCLDRHWHQFCAAVDIPNLVDHELFATNVRRLENRHQFTDFLNSHLQARERAHWVKRLEEHDVPCAPVNGIEDLITSKSLGAEKLIQHLDQPDGPPIPATRSPIQFSPSPAT